jgi:hypothetical protein
VEISDASPWPPTVFSARTVIEPALGGFRALLSRSWSTDTAYPGAVTQSHQIAATSLGQCGVSSVWLAEILDHEYSIRSTFCLGSVIFDDHDAEDLLDHCWLEIDGGPGEELILDLTCDQAQGFNKEIVFDSRASLDRQHVHYNSRERVDTSDLPHNPVWSRYQRLLINMLSQMLAALGGWLPLITILLESADLSHAPADQPLPLAGTLLPTLSSEAGSGDR